MLKKALRRTEPALESWTGNMTLPQSKRPEVLSGPTISVKTPDGEMFVTINELDDKPYEVFITIGKTGKLLMAWAEMAGRLISLALRAGIPFTSILQQISNITTDRESRRNGAVIRSGPEGVAYAFVKYLKDKRDVVTKGLKDDVDL